MVGMQFSPSDHLVEAIVAEAAFAREGRGAGLSCLIAEQPDIAMQTQNGRRLRKIGLKPVVAERTLILQDARASGLAMSELIHALHRI
jgi:hypothetical protein